jgi:hypothetical protein
MERMLAMGTDAGMTAAVGQIDELLASRREHDRPSLPSTAGRPDESS